MTVKMSAHLVLFSNWLIIDLETKISGLRSFIGKFGFSEIFRVTQSGKSLKSSQISGASNHRYLTFENPGLYNRLRLGREQTRDLNFIRRFQRDNQEASINEHE